MSLCRFLFSLSVVSIALACPVESSPAKSPNNTDNAAEGMAFSRVNEPRENAFSILVPQGWSVEGGIFRVNAATSGGPLNAIEAKCDLTLLSADHLVSLRVLPDIVYAHHGIGAGMFAPGSNYQGATVRPFENAQQHLKSLFAMVRPSASQVKWLKLLRLPGEVAVMDQAQQYTNNLLRAVGGEHMTFQNDAAGGIVDFVENGKPMRAVVSTAVVNMRAALTWKNTRSLLFVTPRADFERWRPVLDIVRASTRFHPQWVLRESQGQQQRADFVNKVFAEMRRIDDEMRVRQQVNREEIMNDNYLVLTGQEEYQNPHSGETEVDTNAYKYRWTTAGGDYFYTDREDVDPNTFMQHGDYKRTPVRKRRNE